MSKINDNDVELEMAVQQFIGYGHAAQGYSVIDLAEAMGLTKTEYEQIAGDIQRKIPGSDLSALHAHFQAKGGPPTRARRSAKPTKTNLQDLGKAEGSPATVRSAAETSRDNV
jgi:hypothetical protein